jgi:hypothetical protein
VPSSIIVMLSPATCSPNAVAVGCGDEVAHEAAGDFGGEDDRALLRGDAASAEAAQRALGRLDAYLFRSGEQLGCS